MIIYSLVIDNDGGIECELFTSGAARTLRMEGIIGEAWADMQPEDAEWGDDMEANLAVLEGDGWETRLILGQHEVDVPAT